MMNEDIELVLNVNHLNLDFDKHFLNNSFIKQENKSNKNRK